MPLLLLVLLEGGLRIAGSGHPTAFFVPSQFAGTWRENPKYTVPYFSERLARTPREVLVSTPKPQGVYRILVFGESAAYGDPESDFGVSRFLATLLDARFPGTHFEVINVAITATNSHVVREIAADCVDYEADLWLVYMGNNEVIGPYGAGTIFGSKVPPYSIIRTSIACGKTRIGQLMKRGAERLRSSGSVPAWQGLKQFIDEPVHPTDPKLVRVHRYFRSNLNAVIARAQEADVQLVLSTVASNLLDCPPFGSGHRPGLSAADLAAWEQTYQVGMEFEAASEFVSAINAYQNCESIDDSFAELQFRLGRCLLASHQQEAAYAAFLLARDYDTLRFRADSQCNDHVRDAALNSGDERVSLVDAEKRLAERSPDGIPGFNYFYEHVHYHAAGNHALALLFAEAVRKRVPEQIRATEQQSWLGLEACYADLSYCGWNEQRILREILRRQAGPPYSLQLDHERTVGHWQSRLDEITRLASPELLASRIAQARAALAKRPGDWALRKNLANLLEASGQSEHAVAAWRQVLEAMPHYANAWYHIGTIRDIQGKPQETETAFRAALQQQPLMAEAHNGLGIVLAAQGDYVDAVGHYQQAISIRPSFVSPYVNWGLALANQGDFPGAIASYQSALAVAPGDLHANHNLGLALVATGRGREAMAPFAKALESTPTFDESRFQLAIQQVQHSQFDAAIANFATLVANNPEVAEIRVHYAYALEQGGRREDAATQYRQALALQPGNADAKAGVQRTGD